MAENTSQQKWFSIIGSMLINFLSRIPLYWGNMTVYVISYHVFLGQTGNLISNNYFYTFYSIGWTIFMLSTDMLTCWIRPRYIIFTGLLIFNLFFFGSAFSQSISWKTYVCVFPFVAGAGLGLFESLVLKHHVVEWAGSDDKGMLTALFVTSTNVGGALANQFMTLWTNPSNRTPDLYTGFYVLFSYEEISQRVPSMFLIMGVTSTILQSIGFCLLRDKRKPEERPEYPLGISITYNSVKRVIGSGSNHSSGDWGNSNDNIGSSGKVLNGHNLGEDNSKRQTFLQLIRDPDFLKLYFIFFALTQTYQAVNSFYKVYGSLSIQSDFYFSTLGTVMVIPGFFFNVIIGKCFDKFGLRMCYMFLSASMSCLSLMVYFSAIWSDVLYFIVIVILYTFASAMYTCVAASAVLIFGSAHLSRNLALVTSAGAFSSISVSCVSELVLSHQYGWFWVFAWVSTFAIFALIVTARSFRDPEKS